jgi:hypothetical protein
MADSYFSTLDVTSGTEVKDYSPYFFRTPLPSDEARLMSLMPKRQDAQGDIITWFEDQDIPVTVTAINTADGDLTASDGDTNLVLASGQGASRFVRVGMLLHDTADGKNEVIQVTAISDDSLTITRSIGNTSAEVHSRAAVWEKLGTAQFQGSAFGTPIGTNRVPYTNTMVIMDEQIRLTRSQIKQVMHAVSDNWIFTLERALRHFERTQERAILWNSEVARSSGVIGSCAGIVDLISQHGSAYTKADFGQWKYSAIDAVLCGFYDRGYDDGLVILCGREAITATAYFNQSAVRTDRTDTTRGLSATHIQSTMNQLVPMIPVAGLGDRFIVGQLEEKAVIRYVDTLLAYDIPLGQAGNDFAARRFISEFSLELHDAASGAWYLAEDVHYVVPED